MQQKTKRLYKRIVSVVCAMAMVLTGLLGDIGTMAVKADTLSITVADYAGYAEGAYAEWKLTAGADGYEVYISKDQDDDDSWAKLDNELIRKYVDGSNTYMRADALGLTPGTWYMKIVASTYNSAQEKVTQLAEKVISVDVTAHDRSGFAWVNGTASGAYKEDGSLKDDALVIYLTETNKDKVTATLKDVSAAGIQNILNLYMTENISAPLDVRVIGKITDPEKLTNGDLRLASKTSNSAGVTIEGVGEDATLSGFGLILEDAANVEVRNLGVMLCDSTGGDSISLTEGNDHIWVHNCDLFYGETGKDDDQAKGDGALDCKKSDYVTFSYNHFWDCGKSSLLGLEEGTDKEYHITYHHNWFDHSDSRHPRVRYYTAHIYNNYFDGNSKYGIAATSGCSVFAENNYFRNCQYPMETSMQGTDVAGSNTSSFTKADKSGPEDGGIIKAYGNYMIGQKSFINGNVGVADSTRDGNDKDATQDATSFDAYVVSTRGEKIPDEGDAAVKTVQGEHVYNNFDIADGFYVYHLTKVLDVPKVVRNNAGRLNGGDFTWEFSENDDTSHELDGNLKAALAAYTSKVAFVGGILQASEKINVTVTVDPNNGESYDSVEVEMNQPMSAPVTPTTVPDGKVEFGYWYVNGNEKVKWDFTDPVTGAMTLTAKWYTQEEADAAKNGGTPIGTETVQYSMLVRGNNGGTVIGSPYFEIKGDMKQEAGYTNGVYAAGTTDEWKINVGRFGRLTFNNSAYIKFTTTTESSLLVIVMDKNNSSDILVDGESVSPSEGVLIATLEAGDHVLTNKTSCYLTGIMVVPGASAPDPEYEEDSDNLSLNVGADMEAKTYTANTEINGFTLTSDMVVDGSSKSIDDASYTKRLKTAGAGSTGSRSVKFTTKGTAQLYIAAMSASSSEARSITIEKEGSTTPVGTVDAGTSIGSAIVALPSAGTYYIYGSGAVNIYAIKVTYPVIYTVAFNSNGGSAVAKVKVTSGTALSAPEAPTREDYTFDGWYVDETLTTVYDFSKAVTGNFILYAKWTENKTEPEPDPQPQSYDITFESNGGSEVAKVTVNHGEKLTAPTAPTRDKYTFEGWYTDEALTQKYDFDSAVTAAFKLYAKWTENPTEPEPQPAVFTITFESNGGSAVAAVEVTEGGILTKPANPTRIGYTFDGWYSDKEFTTSYNFNQKVTAAFTLYAKWTALPDPDEPDPETLTGLKVILEETEEGYTYTGSAIKPKITVTNNEVALTEGVDYTVKYSNNVNASANSIKQPTITVTGKGNLGGNETIYFEIKQKNIEDGDVNKVDSIVTTADAISKTVPMISHNGKILKQGKDFQMVREEDELQVSGIGNYTGTITVALDIREDKSEIRKFKVKVLKSEEPLVYDGTEKYVDVLVTDAKDKEIEPSEGVDYDVFYSNNINAGTAKVTVVGKGDYTGTVTKTFKIKPCKLTAYITGPDEEAEYPFVSSGVRIDEDIMVGADEASELVLGTDYKISYSGNKKVGRASFKVTFLGNYKGSKPVKGYFMIKEADLESAKVLVPNKVYTGKPGTYISKPYVSVNAVMLKKSDYTCSYYYDETCTEPVNKANPVMLTGDDDEVTIYVKIEGKKNYAGSETVASYSVAASSYKDLSKKAKVTVVDAYGAKLSKATYTGAPIKPAVQVKLNGYLLTEGDDYTVSYIGNVNKGKATVLITGTGDYAGSKAASFKVVAGNVKTLIQEEVTTEE